MNLTIDDLLHAGQFQAAVERMRTLLRADPTEPVDVDLIRQYEEQR